MFLQLSCSYYFNFILLSSVLLKFLQLCFYFFNLERMCYIMSLKLLNLHGGDYYGKSI
nr:MAG TPA: hypothetical protein [Caudoviricetes sp.]